MSTALSIHRVAILPFGMVNCHLVLSADGCALIDTGLPGSEKRIARALAKHERSIQDISVIVVTHAHVDHAGSAARIRELSGAPIVAHAGDVPHYRQEAPMTYCATGRFGRFFLKLGLIRQPYRAFSPDIELSGAQTLDLQRFGIAGTVRHAGGHTEGSLVVELANDETLAGDLLASGILLGGIVRTRHAIRPPFEDDPKIVASSLQRLIDRGARRFYLGHGGPLETREVQRHADSLATL